MNQKHSGTESRLQGAVDREESKTLTGAERWEIIRRKWLEPPNESKEISRKPKVIAKAIDVDDVIERIFSSSKSSSSAEISGLLKDPLPLAQMIEILTDFWEADGLYD